MNRIKTFFREEIAKLREMNFTDKRQYIWEYYKFQIVVFAISVIFIGSMINASLNPPKGHYLYIAWFGPLSIFHSSDLVNGLEFIVEDPERYEIFLSPYSMPGNPQMQQALVQRFHSMMMLGEIDIVIFNEYYRHDIGNFITTLDPVIDYLFYLHPTGAEAIVETILHWSSYSIWDGERIYPNAFSLRNFSMFYNINMPSDHLFLGLPSGTDNFFRIAKAVLVLFYG